MKFISITPRLRGKFLTAYDAVYETATGRRKTYDMTSRHPDLEQGADLHLRPAEAVILILRDESGERLLLEREFRMTANQKVFNFPAGLMEPGEEAEQAARRELREETGLELTRVEAILPAGYNGLGVSNEKNIFLLGRAAGEIKPSDCDEEEIEAAWYDREQVRSLLQKSPFESRTQLYCHIWAKGSCHI